MNDDEIAWGQFIVLKQQAHTRAGLIHKSSGFDEEILLSLACPNGELSLKAAFQMEIFKTEVQGEKVEGLKTGIVARLSVLLTGIPKTNDEFHKDRVGFVTQTGHEELVFFLFLDWCLGWNDFATELFRRGPYFSQEAAFFQVFSEGEYKISRCIFGMAK